jgi:hypothetical protein
MYWDMCTCCCGCCVTAVPLTDIREVNNDGTTVRVETEDAQYFFVGMGADENQLILDTYQKTKTT